MANNYVQERYYFVFTLDKSAECEHLTLAKISSCPFRNNEFKNAKITNIIILMTIEEYFYSYNLRAAHASVARVIYVFKSLLPTLRGRHSAMELDLGIFPNLRKSGFL